jgi:riboflavin synthase
MFTGIIDHCGKILEIERKARSCHIWIESQFSDLVLGESIAIDGICLTVTAIKNQMFSCDISTETLNITTANQFKQFQLVNLERAMQLSSRLGGHLVSGHIDQVIKVISISRLEEFVEMKFSDVDILNMPLLTKKGSVTINGVSLTVNEITDNGLSVMLIPHTLKSTNLSQLYENDNVNVEFDMVARIIVAQCKRYL